MWQNWRFCATERWRRRKLEPSSKATARHSRFGGSYIVQGLKSIGERDLIFHKGLHNLRNYSSDLGKQPRKEPKRRQAAQELSVQHRSALNVRLFLRDFCSEFLENCYNRLMGAVKVRAWEGHGGN
ncbi:protein timeless homolog [Nannospalax galili]|uniref:protein timeless homolog n=1 Tax=Nannospalax galili TaxID=1026970 RepID=UPI00111C6C39|nr:protein timeless homolog [Nannospalax galili]